MFPQELIRKKRDGQNLSADEITFIAQGIANDSLAEAQVGAFAMASYLNGLSPIEGAALTLAMRDSGTVLQWSDMPGPVLDKHSTGGVGDCTSLLLAPLLAACGACVPMISGRGLGHTGGTLDKLEAIPGYNATPDLDAFRRIVREVGCAIIGQTSDLAPADRRLYSIRDVTATVESIPLITASILSKKLAAGLQYLVMDVKFGSGAFMPTFEKSQELADSICKVAKEAGLPTVALLTNMDQSLAHSAGNSLEVLECIAHLKGEIKESRLLDVTMGLAAELLILGGLASDRGEAQQKLSTVLNNGQAAEYFQKMSTALGGPAELMENPNKHLPSAPIIQEVSAPESGFIAKFDTRAIGMAVVGLGGGRTHPADEINPLVGFDKIEDLGVKVEQGQPLALVHAQTAEDARKATEDFVSAVKIADTSPELPKLIS